MQRDSPAFILGLLSTWPGQSRLPPSHWSVSSISKDSYKGIPYRPNIPPLVTTSYSFFYIVHDLFCVGFMYLNDYLL